MRHDILRLSLGHPMTAVLALALGGHGVPARASALALSGPLVLSGLEIEPSVTLPPVSDLDAAAAQARDQFEVVFNAGVTNNIIRALGSGRPAYMRSTEPDLRAAFAARLHGPAPTSPSLAQLVNPTIGKPEVLAVSFAQHLVSTGQAAAGLNSDLHVTHQSDAVDAGFDLAGRQNFVAPDPMAMSYDSHALVAVTSVMKVGVAARGSLGSINAIGFTGTRSAGPLLHLNLLDRNVSLMSDLGYDFATNTMNATARSQLHVAMNLKLRL